MKIRVEAFGQDYINVLSDASSNPDKANKMVQESVATEQEINALINEFPFINLLASYFDDVKAKTERGEKLDGLEQLVALAIQGSMVETGDYFADLVGNFRGQFILFIHFLSQERGVFEFPPTKDNTNMVERTPFMQ